MRNVVLLISLMVTLVPNIKAHRSGANLLARLDREVHRINDLIDELQEYYRDEHVRHSGEPLPSNWESTLRQADSSIEEALRLMQNIEATQNRRDEDEVSEDDATNSPNNERAMDPRKSTRRSNQLKWKTNFYKALSRALKDEFKDEPVIQENVHDGFVPPTFLKKRGGR